MEIEDFRSYIDNELKRRQTALSPVQRAAIVQQFESAEFLNYESLRRMPTTKVEAQIDSILDKIMSVRLFSESAQQIEMRATTELRAAHCKFPPFCKRDYEG